MSNFRIEKLWGIISVNADGDEGLVVMQDFKTKKMQPLVTAGWEGTKEILEVAHELATETRQRMMLVEFSVRTDLKEIDP